MQCCLKPWSSCILHSGSQQRLAQKKPPVLSFTELGKCVYRRCASRLVRTVRFYFLNSRLFFLPPRKTLLSKSFSSSHDNTYGSTFWASFFSCLDQTRLIHALLLSGICTPERSPLTADASSVFHILSLTLPLSWFSARASCKNGAPLATIEESVFSRNSAKLRWARRDSLATQFCKAQEHLELGGHAPPLLCAEEDHP